MDKDKTIALYRAIQDGNEDRVYTAWHASSIAICPRAHYMKRLGVPSFNKPSAAKILRWSAGHHIESALREPVQQVWGESKSNQRYTSEKLQLTGEFDNLIISNSSLVEIKSVHDYAFIERDGDVFLKEATGELGPRGGKQYRPKKTPYIHHEWQNHAYVALLKGEGIGVKEIDYVYSSLAGRLVVYSTKVQDNILEAVLERINLLNEAWKTKTPPECTCREDEPFWYECNQWCDYRENGTCCVIKEIK